MAVTFTTKFKLAVTTLASNFGAGNPVTETTAASGTCSGVNWPCTETLQGNTAKIGNGVKLEVSGLITLKTVAVANSAQKYASNTFTLASANLKQASTCEVIDNTYPVDPVIDVSPSRGSLTVYLPPHSNQAENELKLKCYTLVSLDGWSASCIIDCTMLHYVMHPALSNVRTHHVCCSL